MKPKNLSLAQLLSLAITLIVKAAILASRWSGSVRIRRLEALVNANTDEKSKEILILEDQVRQLREQVTILRKLLRRRPHRTKRKYTLEERLFILVHLEYYQIPRRKVTEYFGIARSTLYRWLHGIDHQPVFQKEPPNKTPAEVARLVWEIAKTNIGWGRFRIANQMGLLQVFIAASTVRNILNRATPRGTPPASSSRIEAPADPRQIPAWYPNHVWSADLTWVKLWGLWPIKVFVVIDHFSRKVLAVKPLEGPNTAWVLDALEAAILRYGAPKHLITDKEPIFTGDAFIEFLDQWDIKPRYGAVGMHGSIAVTERVIKTLKYEWLALVPLVKGFGHLEGLCYEFSTWYNRWRPHMYLDGARPDDVYQGVGVEKPTKDAKVVPLNIEKKVFEGPRITGYRLKQAA